MGAKWLNKSATSDFSVLSLDNPMPSQSKRSLDPKHSLYIMNFKPTRRMNTLIFLTVATPICALIALCQTSRTSQFRRGRRLQSHSVGGDRRLRQRTASYLEI